MNTFLKKPIVLPVLIGFGILLVVAINSSKSRPSANIQEEYATPVNIVILTPQPVQPKFIGYGNAQPSSNLNVPAEVSAEVVWIHPQLKQGRSLKAGSKVIKFEKRDFELTLAKVSADVNTQNIKVAELAIEERTTKQQYQLAKQKISLARSDFKRREALAKQGAIPRSALDSEKQNLLAQESELENMNLKLALYPKQRDVLHASMQVAKAQQEEQQRNLNRTEVSLPFDARIGSVNIEKGSFINKGSTLFVAQGKSQIEVLTQVPAKSMLPLISQAKGQKPNENTNNLIQQLGIKAKVFLVDGPESAYWPASVLRMNDSIDAKTRSLGLVIGIDNLKNQEIIGVRPPLLKGMYLKVELTAKAFPALSIPRSAIHEGHIYLADKENRLVIEPVNIAFYQDDIAVLQAAPSHSQLITSDLIPAVKGMLLKPITSKPAQIKQ
jgi:multidrug efflux pump subunit AcrA (membrane-fusion protein)